jgi:hypothetical protein
VYEKVLGLCHRGVERSAIAEKLEASRGADQIAAARLKMRGEAVGYIATL